MLNSLKYRIIALALSFTLLFAHVQVAAFVNGDYFEAGEGQADEDYYESVEELPEDDYEVVEELPEEGYDYEVIDDLPEEDYEYDIEELPDEDYYYEEECDCSYYCDYYCECYNCFLAEALVAAFVPFSYTPVSIEAELRAAILAAPTSGIAHVIQVVDDINITGGNIAIPANSIVRLQGDYAITNTTFTLGANSHLIIDGITLQRGVPARNHGIIVNSTNATFTLESGHIHGFNQYGIRAEGSPINIVININGGYITNNGRSGIILAGSTTNSQINLSGGTISGNGSHGIWLYRDAHLIMTGGVITQNPTGVRLGGSMSSTFTMHDGIITKNTRYNYGGAGVWVGNESHFFMYGGEITHNTAPNGAGVRIGGQRGGIGHMIMNGGLIAYNRADADIADGTENPRDEGASLLNYGNGGGIFVYGGFHDPPGGGTTQIRSSTLILNGGYIRNNYATRNGGGVHLISRTNRQPLFGNITIPVTAWASMNFQGGLIFNNTATNDGGGIWVNWTNRIFPATGTAFRDLTLASTINNENIHSNVSRQIYGITNFDRNRLASHIAPGGGRWFADHQISLWNNDQINYAGFERVPLLFTLIYGVREGLGTISGEISNGVRVGTSIPSPTGIGTTEQAELTATPGTLYDVRQWSVGVSAGGTNPLFFTQEQLAELIADGYIAIIEDADGVEKLVVLNVVAVLAAGGGTNQNHIHVFVYFETPYIPTPSPSPTITPDPPPSPSPTITPDYSPSQPEISPSPLPTSSPAASPSPIPIPSYVPDGDGGTSDAPRRPGSSPTYRITRPPRPEPLPVPTATPDIQGRWTHRWFIQGYPEGDVRADGFLTRAEMAAMFFNLSESPDKLTTRYNAGFTDIQHGDWHYRAINYAAVRHNALSGFPDGSFRPNQFITNAEFAAFATEYFNLRDIATRSTFDEPFDHWAYDFMAYSFDTLWFDYFGHDYVLIPDDPIPRSIAVTLVNHYVGRVPNPDSIHRFLQERMIYHDITSYNHWAFYEIMEASITHRFTRNEDGSEIWDIRDNWWLVRDTDLLGNWWFLLE